MKYNLHVQIEQDGRDGYIHVTINDKKFKWYWEFASGRYVAHISVPTLNEWRELLPNAKYERNEILSEVAEEVCRQQCKNCTFEIYHDGIGIVKDKEGV